MRMIQGLFFASFISIMIAMLVSFLPSIELKDIEEGKAYKEKEQAVFQNKKPLYLTKKEVVEFLQNIPLHYPYKQVKLEGNDMFIDIKVNEKEYFSPEEVYMDTLQLISATMLQTENINQVFIRFILMSEEHHQLLAAVTVERDKELLNLLNQEIEDIDIPTFLKENTKLVHGTAWSE